MNLLVGLPILVLLALGFYAARRYVRRDKLRHARARKPKPWMRKMSDRSEMRAYNDPTTMMGSMTDSRSGRSREKTPSKKAARR